MSCSKWVSVWHFSCPPILHYRNLIFLQNREGQQETARYVEKLNNAEKGDFQCTCLIDRRITDKIYCLGKAVKQQKTDDPFQGEYLLFRFLWWTARENCQVAVSLASWITFLYWHVGYLNSHKPAYHCIGVLLIGTRCHLEKINYSCTRKQSLSYIYNLAVSGQGSAGPLFKNLLSTKIILDIFSSSFFLCLK